MGERTELCLEKNQRGFHGGLVHCFKKGDLFLPCRFMLLVKQMSSKAV